MNQVGDPLLLCCQYLILNNLTSTVLANENAAEDQLTGVNQ